MPFATAKDLRTRTREILRVVQTGERVIVTYRGRPVAVLSPANEAPDVADDLRSITDAWPDILRTVRATRPAFRRAEDALRATRRRP